MDKLEQQFGFPKQMTRREVELYNNNPYRQVGKHLIVEGTKIYQNQNDINAQLRGENPSPKYVSNLNPF
jgi:hypothetical protein